MKNKFRKSAAALTLALLPLAACSAGSDPDANSPAAVGFWQGLSINALEVDPPPDMTELVEKSELVIVGTIIEVTAGPVEEAGYGPEETIAQLTVKIEETLGGYAESDSVKVIITRQSVVTIDELNASIPKESMTFFLTPAGFEDYYTTSSQVGIVAPASDGTLETVLEPESSTVIVGDAETLEEFTDEVEAVTSTAMDDEPEGKFPQATESTNSEQ